MSKMVTKVHLFNIMFKIQYQLITKIHFFNTISIDNYVQSFNILVISTDS